MLSKTYKIKIEELFGTKYIKYTAEEYRRYYDVYEEGTPDLENEMWVKILAKCLNNIGFYLKDKNEPNYQPPLYDAPIFSTGWCITVKSSTNI